MENRIEIAIKELGLSVAIVEEVADSFSSDVRIIELTSGEKVVLKVPYNRLKLERELDSLNRLKNLLPVPKVIDVWYGNDEIPGALLLSYIDGKPLELPIDMKMAYSLGRLLGQMHTIKIPIYSLVEGYEEKWWPGVEVRYHEWMKEIGSNMTDDIRVKCDYYFNRFIEYAVEPEAPVFSHFDFRPGNVLVKDNKIVGLIDFESSRGGAAEIDFTKINEYIWSRYPETKEPFLAGYEIMKELPDLSITLPFFLFFNAIGGIGWSVRRNLIDGDFHKENLMQLERSFNGLKKVINNHKNK